MCIPSQVSQSFQNPDQQATYLLRALGALRMLRSNHRIVPDEAGYRWYVSLDFFECIRVVRFTALSKRILYFS